MAEAHKVADELDEFEDKVESTKKSFKEWEEENNSNQVAQLQNHS